MKLVSTLVLVIPAVLVAFTTSASEGPKQAPPGWPTMATPAVEPYYPPSCYLGNCNYEAWGNCAPKGGTIEECIGSCDDASDCMPGGLEKCTCSGDPPSCLTLISRQKLGG